VQLAIPNNKVEVMKQADRMILFMVLDLVVQSYENIKSDKSRSDIMMLF